MSLLPSSPDVAPDGEPRVVGLDSEEADDLMAALSSATARKLLAELHEEPAPPGELADRVDTSLQNAQYHLENLEDAGAIEVVGTAYSEKGREMRVYGPADSPLVIFAGEKERASGLRAALSRLFGGFAALALGSLAIQQVFGQRLLGSGGEDAAPAGGTATPTPTPSQTATPDGGSDDAGDAGAFDARGTDTTPAAEDAETMDGAASTPTESGADTTDGGGVATDGLETATETVREATPTPTPTGDAGDVLGFLDVAVGSGLPPGLAFFLGGATVLTLVVAMTYLRARP
ncbi:winged helix-turn-helix transcriptional regulator [Natronomonas salina]|uniref:ArsR/SmtB family transcription factor n=1 Tax=Natronomonas salina TaxID=1710540 RepID=UPI0015B60A0F|nr:winged helix-turn-helix domain-containing protein [Natronomonas salina]QLD89510.1 winged helix-turn-helix transcriptional regulator [Natronomonas salina]